MEKLIAILSQLQTTDDCLPKETDDVETLSNKISDTLDKYMEDAQKLQDVVKSTEKFRAQEKKLLNEVTRQKKEIAASKEQLEDLQSKYETLFKLDEEVFSGSADEVVVNLKNKLKVFGMDLQAQYIEATIYQAKISFAEGKFIIFNCDIIRNTYDLQAMEPKPPQFEKMKAFLLETGDIVGFLSHARKFFLRDVA